MRLTVQLLFCLMLLPLIGGCKSRNPNPELSDKIYQDLKSTRDRLDKQVESEQKELEADQKALEEAPPQTLDLKQAQMNVKKASDQLVYLQQQLEFYKIRVERRRLEVRLSYDQAFDQGKAWSGDKEYAAYLVNKHLHEAAQQPLTPSKSKESAREPASSAGE